MNAVNDRSALNLPSSEGSYKTTFNEDAELYDRVRPGYPKALYQSLVSLTGLGPGSRVLEIAPGTGQATTQLVELGAKVVGVELGEHLARVARSHLPPPPAAEIVVASFEEWVPPAFGAYDAVACFTAWHWLDPSIRTAKAAALLDRGGFLVTVHTHHVAGGTTGFFASAQRCYERWDAPQARQSFELRKADDIPTVQDEVETSGLFEVIANRRFEWERAYSAREYLELLDTYSDHRSRAADNHEGLRTCIGSLINEEYGGSVSKRYMNEMRVAQKRN